MNQHIITSSFLVIGFAFLIPVGIALFLTVRRAWTPDRKAAATVSILLTILASPILNISVTWLPGFLAIPLVFVPVLGVAAFLIRHHKTYTRRWRFRLAAATALCLALNPWFQSLCLAPLIEPLDDRMNYAFRDRVAQLDVIGKTPDEIRALVGRPGAQWTDTPRMLDAKGNVTWTGETYTAWEYYQMPLYWFGSKFQIFFKDGRVTNYEANDD